MTIVYPPPGKWQEETHLELSQQHGATTWALVPDPALAHPRLPRPRPVRHVVGAQRRRRQRGVAARAAAHARRNASRPPAAGTALGYGSTETTGLGTTLRPGPELAHADSIGTAVGDDAACRCATPRPTRCCPKARWARSACAAASCFLGYWRNPEATAAALDDDRWYRTGDFGVIRDGYVHLEGRRAGPDHPRRREHLPDRDREPVVRAPGVAEVAVIGVDHPKLGQEVVAVVVPHTPGALTEDDVQQWVAAALAGFKVPSRVEFRDALPHNASGKVLKHVLASPETSSGFVEETEPCSEAT